MKKLILTLSLTFATSALASPICGQVTHVQSAIDSAWVRIDHKPAVLVTGSANIMISVTAKATKTNVCINDYGLMYTND